MGALDMGLSPGLLPGRTTLGAGRAALLDVWPNMSDAAGSSTSEMLAAGAAGDLDVLILLGADPLNDAPDHAMAAAALERTPKVIAVDLFATPSVATADVVLPAAAFTETSGSHTNVEGRVSPIQQKVTAPGTARPDWAIAAELAAHLGEDLGITEPADVWRELAPRSNVHSGLSTETIEQAADGVMVNQRARSRSNHPPSSAQSNPSIRTRFAWWPLDVCTTAARSFNRAHTLWDSPPTRSSE